MTGPIGRLLDGASARLQAADSAINLSIARIIICVWLFPGAADTAWRGRSLPEVTPVAPELLGGLLVQLPRDPHVLRFAAIGLAASTCLGALGWKTRWAMWGVLVFGTYHLSIGQIFGKVDHNHHILWIAFVLALSPCGDTVSVDAWRSRVPARSPRYGFPLRIIWILIGLTYLFPGFWKAALGGTEWFSADNMARLMWSEWFARGGYEPVVDISSKGPLLVVAGATAILIELAFVFLILDRRTRPLAIVGGVALHLGIGLTIGIWFVDLALFYPLFIDLSKPVLHVSGAPVKTHGVVAGDRETRGPFEAAGQIVLIVLVLSVFIAGMDRRVHGWPVASYPDFANLYPPVLVVMDLRAGSSSVSDEVLAGLSELERQRLLNRAFRDVEARGSLESSPSILSFCERNPGAGLAVVRQPWHVDVQGPSRMSGSEQVTLRPCGG